MIVNYLNNVADNAIKNGDVRFDNTEYNAYMGVEIRKVEVVVDNVVHWFEFHNDVCVMIVSRLQSR